MMGGRGSSSGMSDKGKKYGTEYETLYESGNIKFIQYKDSKAATPPMETMTKGRMYVTVNKNGTLKYITYYDKANKRYKQIDLSGQPHMVDGKPTIPHTHKGYEHNEKGTYILSGKEEKIVDRVKKTWNYYYNR